MPLDLKKASGLLFAADVVPYEPEKDDPDAANWAERIVTGLGVGLAVVVVAVIAVLMGMA